MEVQQGRRPAYVRYAPTAVIAASLLPLVLLHLWLAVVRDGYWHVPIVLLAVPGLCWQRWPNAASRAGRTARRYSVPLMIAGYVTALASVALGSPASAAAAAILVVGAWLFDLCGRAARRLVPAWLLLWLLVAPPPDTVDPLVARLTAVSAQWASLLLDLGRVKHLFNGDGIEMPGKLLHSAGDMCADAQTALALLTIAAAVAVFTRRKWLSAIAVIVSTALWIFVCDVIRIVAVVAAQVYAEIDLTEGVYRYVTPLVAFAVALCMIVCTDRLVAFLAEPVHRKRPHREQRREAVADAKPRKTVPGLSRSWVVAGLFAVTVGIPSAVVLLRACL